MRAVIALTLCALAATAAAHQEGDGEQHKEVYFDCARPPADALHQVPAELAGIARLQCTALGQLLMPGNEWAWRYPGNLFAMPNIAAYAARESQDGGEPRYFRSVRVKELAQEERKALHARFAGELSTYAAKSVPQRMLQLSVVNDAGHSFEVYLPFETGEKAWFISCVPDCPAEYVFLAEKLGR